MLKERLIAIVTVLVIGSLLIASVLISAILAAVGELFPGQVTIPVSVLSFIGVTILFAALLRYVPDAKPCLRDVWVGAVVNALIFTGGKQLIGLYLGRAAVGSLYGAGASTFVVVVWVYYSAQLFLFGAEFTRVFGQYRSGKPS